MEPYIIKGKTTLRSKLVKCSVCGREQTKQGIGAHMRLAHGITKLNKSKPFESAVEASVWADPLAAPQALAEFILKLFKGDEKKLIQTVKEVKKKQDDD